MDYEKLQKFIDENANGEWISVDDELPEIEKFVFVKRTIKLYDDFEMSVEDVGILHGTENWDRFDLLSQTKSPLPLSPTLSSKIVTHWMEIPHRNED